MPIIAKTMMAMKETLRVTLVQTSLHWEDKAANMAMLGQKILDAEPSEIVLLPEMFSTGFSMQPGNLGESMDGPTVQWMKALAAKKRIIICGSAIISENGHYYNRMLWVQPNGEICHYDKRHLFAYAKEDEHYTAGNKRLIVSVNGWRILLLVCYDLRFPVWSRQQNNHAQYDAIFYVANWPERRNLAWKTLLPARAIENQSYVVAVNRVGRDGHDMYYSGDSAVYDAMGTTIFSNSHDEIVSTISLSAKDLQECRSKLPFLKDADNFSIYP